MTTTYTVRAVKWSGGWELHIGDIGVTQVRTLDKAAAQVRDYLETLHDKDMEGVEIVVVPELNGLEKEVVASRREISEAARAQRHAAERSRAIARELRATGLSVTDTAAVLGISRGRVSQLVN
ncbi:MAG: antitoxin HicB [Kineosporiaceae bacterium]|nr:antitoxin HicB [Aeromicrobium sp.]